MQLGQNGWCVLCVSVVNSRYQVPLPILRIKTKKWLNFEVKEWCFIYYEVTDFLWVYEVKDKWHGSALIMRFFLLWSLLRIGVIRNKKVELFFNQIKSKKLVKKIKYVVIIWLFSTSNMTTTTQLF